MKIQKHVGWEGTNWTGEDGKAVKQPINFYAKLVSTGQEVIVISQTQTIRDHGASWKVANAKIYLKDTLEELHFTYEESKDVWLEV